MAKMGKGISRAIGDSPALRLNLKDIFGTDLSNQPAVKLAVAQAFIDKIVERTQGKSQSWDGKKFAGYSKEYKKSLRFKAFGKSSKVDMTLTGDMLGNITTTGDNGNIVEIGWGSVIDAQKAKGHITGDVGKKRDFFGINNKEVEEIKSEFSADIADAKSNSVSFANQIFQEALLERIGGFSGNGES